jgi:hypothetical protein
MHNKIEALQLYLSTVLKAYEALETMQASSLHDDVLDYGMNVEDQMYDLELHITEINKKIKTLIKEYFENINGQGEVIDDDDHYDDDAKEYFDSLKK